MTAAFSMKQTVVEKIFDWDEVIRVDLMNGVYYDVIKGSYKEFVCKMPHPTREGQSVEREFFTARYRDPWADYDSGKELTLIAPTAHITSFLLDRGE